MRLVKRNVILIMVVLSALLNINSAYSQELTPDKPHMLSCPKLLVNDLPKTQKFYETILGMKVLLNFSMDVFSESIMSFDGQRTDVILFAPVHAVEAPLEKSALPMMALYTPEFDALVERLKKVKANYKILERDEKSSLIVEDPSGNWLEIIARSGQYELAGAKMIVDNLAVAKDFYRKLLGTKVKDDVERSDTVKEVTLTVGNGPHLSLYQSDLDKKLPNSQFPITFFQTIAFDAVVSIVEQSGFEHNLHRMDGAESGPSAILVVKDPSGNWIEIGSPLNNGF